MRAGVSLMALSFCGSDTEWDANGIAPGQIACGGLRAVDLAL